MIRKVSKQIGELSMVHSFSSELRGEYIQQLEGDAFDLLVIGGGVAGAGIALDAVVRGMKTVLIERADFASGSSGALIPSYSIRFRDPMRYCPPTSFKLSRSTLMASRCRKRGKSRNSTV